MTFIDIADNQLIVISLLIAVFLAFAIYLMKVLSGMGRKLEVISTESPGKDHIIRAIPYRLPHVESQQQVLPKELLNQDLIELGDPGNPIQFNRISFDSNLSRSALGDFFGAALPPAIIDLISGYQVKGLFKSTVDPKNLIKYDDGGFSSITRKASGRIGKHSGFVQASPAGVLAPIMIFQALSLVTSQYYQHRITEQLTALTKRLEDLVQLHHNEKASLLQAHYNRLCLLGSSKRSFYGIEDIMEIRMIRKDALAINTEYMNLLKKIDLENTRASATNSTWAKKNLKALEKELVESRLLENSNTIIFSKRLLMAANLLEMKVNVHLAQEDSRRAEAIPQFLEDLNVLNTESNKDKIVVQNVLDGVKPILIDIEDSAVLKSNKKAAQLFFEKYIREVQSTLIEASKIEQEIYSVTEKVEKKLNTPVDTYVLIDDEGNQQQLHRMKEEVEVDKAKL